jgi:hypothetical protein
MKFLTYFFSLVLMIATPLATHAATGLTAKEMRGGRSHSKPGLVKHRRPAGSIDNSTQMSPQQALEMQNPEILMAILASQTGKLDLKTLIALYDSIDNKESSLALIIKSFIAHLTPRARL